VAAYPNIMIGKNPWLMTSSPGFPLPIKNIQCLEVKFKVLQAGITRGNLAFDLWITDSPTSQPEDITHEVMIWLDHHNLDSGGSRVDTLNMDGKELGLYLKEDHNPTGEYSWTYLAFIYQQEFTSGSIDLLEFLDYLVDQTDIEDEHYLASIQLGNEIISGQGQTLLKEYQVELCSK